MQVAMKTPSVEKDGALPTPYPAVVKTAWEEKRRAPTWKQAVSEFTQTTTLHGVRFICLEHAFLLRRLFWLVLCLSCTAGLAYQIIDRIIYFYSWPVTVNVDVNFNKTLAFPAVTLCNQNAFRTTAATQKGLYRLIEDIYENRDEFNSSSLDLYNRSDMTLDALFTSTAHRKEDLILRCLWQGDPCGPDNFTTVFTDHGVCFTFNYDRTKDLTVSSTGSDYGLKLTLNVEQYEYMPGPHDAAGVKLQLHDQNEAAKVQELGLAVPTGSHAFIGIQLVSIENLPEPRGECGEKESEFFPPEMYSTDSCQMSCLTHLIMETCGCRHQFMPNRNGYPPICSLEAYFNCYLPNIDHLKQQVRDECACPVPCTFLIFDPTISFATTSAYATGHLLASSDTVALKQRFHEAMETSNRMDRRKYDAFNTLAASMRGHLNAIKDVVLDQFFAKLDQQEVSLKAIFDEVKSAFDLKLHLYLWQEYHVQKNFMRVRDAMEERTFNSLALGFQEYSFQVEAKIHQVAELNSQNESVRQALYLLTRNQLEGRMDLAQRAFDNYTQLFSAYYNGTPVFRYKFKSESRSDNPYITPKPLMREALTHNSYASRYSWRLGQDCLKFRDAMQRYLELLEIAYHNYTVNETDIYLANVMFLWRGRRLYHSKSTMYFESVDYPLRILRTRIEEFNYLWRDFEAVISGMQESIRALKASLASLRQTILVSLEEGAEMMHDYFAHANVTKLSVAQTFTSTAIFEGIINLKVFFQAIRSRGQDIYDGWTALVPAVTSLWQPVLTDHDSLDYYLYKNLSLFLRNFSDVSAQTRDQFLHFRDDSDFRFVVGSKDSIFLKSLEDVISYLQGYIEEGQVNQRFIRDNFLQLDIYYRERSYEQITQQVAYDVLALFCDIGGSMGLFLGASVLTIFELVDLVLHNSIYRITHGVS